MEAFPRLNSEVALLDRLADVLPEAVRLDVAVAYVKATGVEPLLDVGLPAISRFVVGIGFALTDPEAVERLEEAGATIRVFVGSDLVPPSGFHPKLYIVAQKGTMTVFSGSANLTGGGLAANIEQYEELWLPLASPQADAHARRFHALWSLGLDLAELRATGAWEAYGEWAAERRDEDGRRAAEEARRAEAIHDRIAAPRRRPGVRVDPQPGYLAITHPAWWDQQLEQWPDAGPPVFWRLRTSGFRVLRPGGRFFHILNRGGVAADERAVAGTSVFLGDYEVMAAEEAWDRYGVRLGVGREGDMSARLGVGATDEIGLIHLDQPLAFADPPTLGDLLAAGVPYEREIVSGRGLTDAEVDIVLRVGGLAA